MFMGHIALSFSCAFFKFDIRIILDLTHELEIIVPFNFGKSWESD